LSIARSSNKQKSLKMKKTIFLIIILFFIGSQMSGQVIFDLDPSQSMSITGKGPGQDATKNPYSYTNSLAIIENIGKNDFVIRVQEKDRRISTLTIKSNQVKEVALSTNQELYFDSDLKARASIEFKKRSNTIQVQNTLSPKDLKSLQGEWSDGSLTYMDYSSNKPFSMPAKVKVMRSKNGYHLTLDIQYPNEPHANSKEKIRLSKDGTLLNKHLIESRKELPDGELEITTSYAGKDNNKKAMIRNIYIIGESRFIIKKSVKFEDATDWLLRNEYEFTR